MSHQRIADGLHAIADFVAGLPEGIPAPVLQLHDELRWPVWTDEQVWDLEAEAFVVDATVQEQVQKLVTALGGRWDQNAPGSDAYGDAFFVLTWNRRVGGRVVTIIAERYQVDPAALVLDHRAKLTAVAS